VAHAARLMFKDLLFVTIGLLVSLILAAVGNAAFRESLLGF
jgi:hypothetical protein